MSIQETELPIEMDSLCGLQTMSHQFSTLCAKTVDSKICAGDVGETCQTRKL